MTVYFLITGDLHSLTGGYLYNMHMINGLKKNGHTVNVLGTDWQWKDSNGFEKICRYHLEKLPPGSCVVIDSLVLASMYLMVQEFGGSLIFFGLIHLPASYDILSGVQGELGREELLALNHMHGVIVTGRFSFDLLCNAGLNPLKIRIVEPGTDPFPRKKHYKPVPSELLCISNYSALKAQDLLIRALYRLSGKDWMLHFYGDLNRDKEYTALLRSLIRQLKMEHRIILNGIVERHEISKVFLKADLFVMPSLFESYGMALTESLAHGIPVVSTRAGNIPFTVPAGMGLLIEPGNEEQLEEAIRSLFDDPAIYTALCSAASRYPLQSRSWEKAVTNFELIIRNTLDAGI
jgi:glycosyltransferase involved in cell wall biosynthesis